MCTLEWAFIQVRVETTYRRFSLKCNQKLLLFVKNDFNMKYFAYKSRFLYLDTSRK